MLRMFFALLLLSFSSLYSETPDTLATTENEPSALVEGKVSAITGDFYAFEEDLVVRGAEPLRICRSYLSRKPEHWAIIPHAEARYHPTGDDRESYLIAEPNGSEIVYVLQQIVRIDGVNYRRFEPHNLSKGFCNTSQGLISSHTNRQNNYLLLDSKKEKWLTLYCSDGAVRSYKRQHKTANFYLLNERLPNGHRVIYEYADSTEKHSTEKRLVSIRTTNASETKTYAKAEFQPPLSVHPTIGTSSVEKQIIITSDGQKLEYGHSNESGTNTGKYLAKVVSPQSPDIAYAYKPLGYHYSGYYGQLLTHLSLPLNRQLALDYYLKDHETVNGESVYLNDTLKDIYVGGNPQEIPVPDPRRGRIKTLAAPVGSDATPHLTHFFIYDLENRKTSVYDIEQSRTDYSWNESFRLEKIERFSKAGKLLNAEQFVWGEKDTPQACCLMKKSFLDSTNHPLYSRQFLYDSKGNIIEEKFCGNLSGNGAPQKIESYSKRFQYRYGEHGFTLLVREEDDSGRVILHDYLPDTNLPISELICDGPAIKLRRFFEYDADLILIRTLTDNGSSNDKNNLSGVTTRLITEITPITTGQYLGMPHTLEEKYLDQGQEKLLRKTVLTYTTGRLIAGQDIYDANDDYRYSLETTYDEKGRPVSTTNALGQTQVLTYDACGNCTRLNDYSGRLTVSTTYDCSNRPILEQKTGDDGIVLESRYSYDSKHRKIHEQKPFGHTVSYTYDALGHLHQKQLPALLGNPQPIRFTYTRDSAGCPIAEQDPDGVVTKTSYTAYKQPYRIEHPDGGIETFSYALDGTLRTSTDPEKLTTSYTYDIFGRITSKTLSFQDTCLSNETFEYNAFHLLAKTDAEGHRTTYAYDPAGRLIAEELDSERIEYAYDSLSRRCLEKRGALCSIQEYDLLDHPLEERSEDEKGQLLLRTEHTYDAAGLLSSTTKFIDSQTATETYHYDSHGRLQKTTDPLGHATLITYEPLSNQNFFLKKTITDPLGLQTVHFYDAHGHIAATEIRNNTLLSREECSHNFRGQTLLQTSQIFDPVRTVSTQQTYDAMGRLTQLVEAAHSPEERTTSYIYDKTGRLLKVTKPSGTTLSYTYNPLGHLASLISSDHSVHYTYVHSPLGHLLQSTDMLTHQSTTRSYDAHAHLLEETLANGCHFANRYDSQGRRLHLTLPDQTSIRYTYDPLHLRTITRYNFSDAPVYTHTINTYDLSGHPLEETLIGACGPLHRRYTPCNALQALYSDHFSHQVLQRDAVSNILKAEQGRTVSTYTYDPLYQLTSENSHTYQYDAHFCRTQKDSEKYALNALFQDPSHYRYDANGNPLQNTDTTYAYDALDRLITVQSPSTRLHFTYDTEHRRLSKTAFTFANNAWQQTTYERYLYDGQNEIGAITPDGTIHQLRILAATPHAEIGAAIAVELQGQTYVPAHDLMGNVIALLRPDTGEPTTTHQYTSFGEESPSNTPFINPWRFSSKRTDPETNLVYYGRRYYNPSSGRWLTPDPLGYVNGSNLYSFVRNNPLTHTDDYGLLMMARDYETFRNSLPPPNSDYPSFSREVASAVSHSVYDTLARAGSELDNAKHFLMSDYQPIWTPERILQDHQTIDTFFDTHRAPAYNPLFRPAIEFSYGELPLPATIGRSSPITARTSALSKDIFRACAPTSIPLSKTILRPSEVRFSQPTICQNFQSGGSINDLISNLRSGNTTAHDILKIRVVEYEGTLVTLDNRRLAAFKSAGLNEIPIQRVSLSDPKIHEEFRGKFNPIEGGKRIVVISKACERRNAENLLREYGKIK